MRANRTVNRAAWSPEEHAEYEALLEEVVSSSRNTGERLDLMERLMVDAIQAHRPWASEVARSATRHGYAAEIKAHQDRANIVLVSYEGRPLNVPGVQSRRVRNATGNTTHQRELISKWTWEQIADKRVEAIRTCRSYEAKIAHYDRLLALRELCPDSTTPIEAAERLGINLDDFLVRKVEAA